ncbi:18495_t:CDS:2 [Entrophospora sp. SA101]|nr:6147_t:CDS:2 [Entrophospora sp. SA101]CAJ0762923.1 18494_t:CDS:2 [Entrophospora sp. SA101]CAJ0762924.1 18495_t:CDS:2 [Entrophospora sp. SA101]CAJ0825240.1 673_t:CDS:2 [Entrophospora sp. SA101]CAJ0825243.1 674_t:CDS:2 [Entrophospora sp. SA101]
MAKIFLIVALIASLAISCIAAANLEIKVGSTSATPNIFEPSTGNVMTGDTVTFTWVAGKHSVFRSDAAKSCVKSASLNALDSAGAFTAPKTFVYTVTETTGKIWFFCGVGDHCANGMYGTLTVGAANTTAAPPESPKSAAFKVNSNIVAAASMAAIGAIGLLL